MVDAMTGTSSPRTVTVGSVAFGGNHRFALIAGPCAIEGRDHALRHAEGILAACRATDTPVIYKSSFDKANRSSTKSYRGPGLEEGLDVLAAVRREFEIPVLTDIHLPEHAASCAEVVDCLQIPAFLCRQTDLLLAAAETGKVVNVKKGQFLAPGDTQNIVDKFRSAGHDRLLLTERGTSFGYNTLVVDYTGFPIMRATGQPLVFDATHAVQQPGGRGTTTGGDRANVPYLARAAVACGIDGLFVEVHENPDQAPSDGPNMLRLDALPAFLEQLRRIEIACRPAPDAN